MKKLQHRARGLAGALALIVSGSACSGDLTPPATMILTPTGEAATTPEPTRPVATATPAYEELSVRGGSYDGLGREHFRVNDPVQIQEALDLVGRWMRTINAAQQVGSTVSAGELAEQLKPLMDSVPSDLLDEMSAQSEDIARQRKSLCANREDFAVGIVAQRDLNQNVWLPQEESGIDITGPFVLDMGVAQGWDMLRASDGTWYSEYLRLEAPARTWYRSPQRVSEETGAAVFSAGLRFRDGEWRVAWATGRCGDIDVLGGFYPFIADVAGVEATSTPAIPVNTPVASGQGYTPANQADADAVIASAQSVLDLLAFKDGPPADLDSLEATLREYMLPQASGGICGLPELMTGLRRDLAANTYIRMTQAGPYQWEPVEFSGPALVPDFNKDIGQWELASIGETVQWDGRLDRVDVASGEVVQSGSTTFVSFTFGVILIDDKWWVSSINYCDLSQFFVLE